jgi:protein tyrosine/serine phosphatase
VLKTRARGWNVKRRARKFNVPVSRAHMPDAHQIEELFALMDAAGSQPVFVHCKRGADRTGVLIAVYRVSHDGWTAERALEEAERYGMASGSAARRISYATTTATTRLKHLPRRSTR